MRQKPISTYFSSQKHAEKEVEVEKDKKRSIETAFYDSNRLKHKQQSHSTRL